MVPQGLGVIESHGGPCRLCRHSMPGRWPRTFGSTAGKGGSRGIGRAIRDGSPLQSGQALLSTLFSLFPTLEAHCIVATHYILPSSPCSLFSTQNPLAVNAARGFCVEKKVRAALLSRALERTIIAAGGLNGRVRDGNGCLTPASGTNQRDWLRPSQSGERRCSRLQRPCRPRTGPSGAAFPPPSMLPARALPTGGGSRAGGVQTSRPIRSGMVNASRRLRIRPVKRVFFPRPSGTCVRDG